jgi:hypothetical protein
LHWQARNTCYTERTKTLKEAGKVLLLKILNVNCAPLNLFYYWKIRNSHHCAQANAGKTVYAQFAKAQSNLRGFSKRKLKRDNPKKVIPPLAIGSDFLHRVFPNPCTR